MNTPELSKISGTMEKIIAEIGKYCADLDRLGNAKAKAAMAYDGALAIHIVKLKQNNPVTILEKIAKGEVSEQLYDKMVAESAYKSCISKLEARKAQLNALQSLYRHQETV